MATYAVSYRGKNGERIEEQFEAPDRNSLFKILADRKISAISVKDGAAPKRKKSSAPSKPLPPSVLRGAFAGVALVALAIIVWLVLSNRQETTEMAKESSGKYIAEVAPNTSSNVVAKAEEPEPVPEKIEKNKLYRDKNGKVIYHPEFPVGSPANPIRLAPVEKPGNILPPKKLYKTFAENYVVGLMRTRPGMPAVNMALPPNFDEEFIARIADPVGIEDDDSEEDIAMRKEMVEVKKEIAKLIAEGRKPSEIILEERRKINELADTRTTLLQEIGKMRRNGESQDDIDMAIEAANMMLEKKGIPKIGVPAMFKEAALRAAAAKPANN